MGLVRAVVTLPWECMAFTATSGDHIMSSTWLWKCYETNTSVQKTTDDLTNKNAYFISGLQNDHKVVMKEIEEGLHAVHAEAKARKSESEESMEVCIKTFSKYMFYTMIYAHRN